MSIFKNIKKNISKVISGAKKLSGAGIKVAKEGIELWGSIKTLNIIGIAKNGFEFLSETNNLLDETKSSLQDAGQVIDDIKNGIVNSQVLKDVKKELGDVQLQWNKLQDALQTNGTFAAVPELLTLSTEVSQVITASTTGISSIASQLGNEVIDDGNMDPAIKDNAQEVGKIIETGIKIIESGIENVQEAQKYVEAKVNVLKDLTQNNAVKDLVQSILGGVGDVDKAKSQIVDSKSQNNDKTVG